MPGGLSAKRDAGNTVVVIEHNLVVIKTADWILDTRANNGRRSLKAVSL